MKKELAQLLKHILGEINITGVEPDIEIPENPAHGDYTTNVAMKIFASQKQNESKAKLVKSKSLKTPMEIALEVKKLITCHLSLITHEGQHPNIPQNNQTKAGKVAEKDILQAIDRVEVAPPGFINFFLTEAALSTELYEVLKEKEGYGTLSSNPSIPSRPSQKIMVEFAHPNTHKAFHIGHVRNIATGESIVRLLESQAARVIRANYQGDVGMHIAKALYALLRLPTINKELLTIRKKDIKTKVEFLGKAYAAGSKSFDENEEAKKEIGEINKKIYAKDPSVYPLYRETRQWSLDYFEGIYRRLGTRYDRYYFESEVFESGKALVLEGLKKGIFEKSQGAVIFPGERFGFHNRVFISGEGNATYEGKDMGLGQLQFDEYHSDKIIHVVGPEQTGYFQVVFEALARIFPETRGREYHLAYGWVRLKKGKMSSRLGNVVLGEWLLDTLKQKIYKILQKSVSTYSKEDKELIAEAAAVAAVKYSFLRVSTTQEIAFDIDESINFEGDSGPYLLYTYARCRSVLRKAQSGSGLRKLKGQTPLNPEERLVCRLLVHFPDVVAAAAVNLAPGTLCKYLFELAQAFNLFYAKHTILGSAENRTNNLQPTTNNSQSAMRIALTSATSQVLKNGLYLLGIASVERM